MANANLVEPELNITRSAARSGFHPNTVAEACRRGELAHRWLDGRLLIRVDVLDAWAASRSRRSGYVPATREVAAS
ncbi:MAG: helix-turn-helix domain-containing protein [Thermoanaerobaculia bacterium]